MRIVSFLSPQFPTVLECHFRPLIVALSRRGIKVSKRELGLPDLETKKLYVTHSHSHHTAAYGSI